MSAYPAPQSAHPWVPSVAAQEPALPVAPRQYHEFWKAPRYRWWRSLLALLMGLSGWFVVSGVIGLIGISIDVSLGNATLDDFTNIDNVKVTPNFFLFNNLAIAAAIPIAYLTQWACTGQRPRWLSSVVGRIRWGWLLRCSLVILPLYLVLVALDVFESPNLQVTKDTWFLIGVVLLTTPLQAAGEEILLRGLVLRSIAGWLPRMAGLAVGLVVNAAIFMSLHLAKDVWLNAFYLFFALIATVLVWRTGGIEAAVALHVVNNLSGLLVAPFRDFSNLFDRSSGTAGPSILIQFGLMTAAAALILWQAHRLQLATEAAPAADASTSPGPWGPQPPVQPSGQPGFAQPALQPGSQQPWQPPAQPGSEQPWQPPAPPGSQQSWQPPAQPDGQQPWSPPNQPPAPPGGPHV